jgi:hypothetical protein
MHPRPSEKTGELLTVNVKAETEAIPAEKGAKDFIETCEVQIIRHGQDPDHHRAYLA